MSTVKTGDVHKVVIKNWRSPTWGEFVVGRYVLRDSIDDELSVFLIWK